MRDMQRRRDIAARVPSAEDLKSIAVTLIICEACCATTVAGQSCETCGHMENDATCICDHCLMREESESGL